MLTKIVGYFWGAGSDVGFEIPRLESLGDIFRSKEAQEAYECLDAIRAFSHDKETTEIKDRIMALNEMAARDVPSLLICKVMDQSNDRMRSVLLSAAIENNCSNLFKALLASDVFVKYLKQREDFIERCCAMSTELFESLAVVKDMNLNHSLDKDGRRFLDLLRLNGKEEHIRIAVLRGCITISSAEVGVASTTSELAKKLSERDRDLLLSSACSVGDFVGGPPVGAMDLSKGAVNAIAGLYNAGPAAGGGRGKSGK